MASSIRPTSANLPSTALAASSGTPLRLRVAASCARVRGAAVSWRRQISRATDSGSDRCWAASPELSSSDRPRRPRPALSPRTRAFCERGDRDLPEDLPGTALSRHHPERRPARRRRRRRHVGIQPRPDPQLFLDLLLDLVGYIGVLAQVVPGVLLALTELVALVGVPGAGLADDRLLHAQVNQAAFPTYTDSIQNVEFGDAEWGAALVLHDLDFRPVADRLVAVLQRLDPPDVQSYRCIELQCLTASRRLRAVVHHDAVDEVVVAALDPDVEPVH